MPRSGATLVNSGQGSIGDIKHAMLSEAQFQARNGTGWILADGRNVAGSKYATVTGNSTVPDLRGVALRGKNNGRVDGNQDPDGERALGNFQSSGIEAHQHDMFTRASSGSAGAPVISSSAAANSFTDTISIKDQSPATADTRMKNVAVNVFIKIN